MSAIVGAVNINTNSGTINMGNTAVISPQSNTKSITGQGGSNTGNIVNVLNNENVTNTIDTASNQIAGNV